MRSEGFSMPRYPAYSLWLIFVALETGAQVTLKLASNHAVTSDILLTVSPIVSSPWFIASIACDAANLAIWLAILQRHDLSVAVPLTSVTYFAVLLATGLFLREPIQMIQLVGLILVGLGLTLVTWGQSPAE